MQHFAYIICVAALVFLSACEEWPPHQKQLKTHFIDHESDFRLLEAKILNSKYLSVVDHGGAEPYGVFIERESGSEQEVKGEQLTGEEDWTTVLRRSGIEEVERDSYSNALVFLRKAKFKSDLIADTDWLVGYTNDSSLRDTLKQCRDISRDLPCGFCISDLQDNWSVKYFWFPGSSEVLEALRGGDMSEAEAMALATGNSSACLRENWNASFK